MLIDGQQAMRDEFVDRRNRLFATGSHSVWLRAAPCAQLRSARACEPLAKPDAVVSPTASRTAHPNTACIRAARSTLFLKPTTQHVERRAEIAHRRFGLSTHSFRRTKMT